MAAIIVILYHEQYVPSLLEVGERRPRTVTFMRQECRMLVTHGIIDSHDAMCHGPAVLVATPRIF